MLSDEEKKAIEEQYKKGLVNLSNVIEPLINQFKTDYSLDIQQCRLIINYLLLERDFNETYYDDLDTEIEELKIQNNKLAQCHFKYEEMTGVDLLLPDKLEYTSNDKIKEMLNGYKKALKDVEEAIAILKTNLLIVADEKNKKEIDKELKFREEDKISKIAIINLLEDLLKEE